MNFRRQVVPVMFGTLSVFSCSSSDSGAPLASAGAATSVAGSSGSAGAGTVASAGASTAGAAAAGDSGALGGGSSVPIAGSAGSDLAMGGSTPMGGASPSGGAGGTNATGGVGAAGGTNATGGVGTAGAGTMGSGGALTGPSYPYIMSCFNDATKHSSLVIYTSTDGLNFKLLLDTQFTGPTTYLRDPSIMRHTDGKYYVAFTTAPDETCCGDVQSFGIASSSNLKDWKLLTTVQNGVAGATRTWSPEWFVDSDGSVHITATIGHDNKAYRYEPLDATLTKWSGPTAIGMGGPIDYQIFKIGSTYHVVTGKGHATAPALDGPWTFDNLEPECKEGPAIVHISGSTWRYYCDNGGSGHEKTSLSTNLFQAWSTLETLPGVGNDISQGTVIRGDTGHPY